MKAAVGVFFGIAVFSMIGNVRAGTAAATGGHLHTNTAEVNGIDVHGDEVWVATRGGLAVHDRGDGRFLRKLTSVDGLAGTGQRAVFSLGERGVLTGGEFGLSLVETSGERRVVRLAAWKEVYDPVFDLLVAGTTPMVVRFGSGPVFLDASLRVPKASLGSRGWRAAAWNGDRGLAVALDGTLAWFDKDDPSPKPALDMVHPAVAVAPFEGGFAVATGQSISLLEGGGLEPVEDFRNKKRRAVAATTLEPDGRGGLYVGTSGGQIWRLHGRKLELLGKTGGARITAIRADRRTLWLGLAGSGLHRFDLESRKMSPALRPEGEICSNHVTHVVAHRKMIVAGTFDEGACYWDGARWKSLEGLPSPYVLGLASDGEELWVGTSQGLARFGADLKPLPFGPKAPRLLREVSALATGSLVAPEQGQFVFSTTLGVIVANRAKSGFELQHYKWREGVPGHRTAIATSDAAIYIASEHRGVTEMTWAGKKARVYLDPVHLPEAWVMDVKSAGEAGIWVGTCQEGVAFVRGDESVHIDEQNGLPDDRVIALAPHSGGAFVGTLGGLGYAAPDGSAVTFDALEWLPDPRVSALAIIGKSLWVGTEAGLVVHDLKELSKETHSLFPWVP